jgi:transposase-like protein
MSLVSVSEAARLVGKNRKTLYRAIDTGRLSATTSATGERQVDIAELVRVYGELRHTRHSDTMPQMSQHETANATDATAEFKAQIAALKAENEQLKARLADGKEHINDLRQQVLMLRDMRPQETARPSWWRRIFL